VHADSRGILAKRGEVTRLFNPNLYLRKEADMTGYRNTLREARTDYARKSYIGFAYAVSAFVAAIGIVQMALSTESFIDPFFVMMAGMAGVMFLPLYTLHHKYIAPGMIVTTSLFAAFIGIIGIGSLVNGDAILDKLDILPVIVAIGNSVLLWQRRKWLAISPYAD